MGAGLLLGVGLKVTLSAALGMGWYSLAGPLVTASLGSVAGATAFTANLLRELFTIVAYPFFFRRAGGRNSIALGGATTMDTTLPVVSSVGGADAAALGFMHGVLIAILVPPLMALALAAVP
jgi:uncharacterized membrane protein YbjE (DUF340 family)